MSGWNPERVEKLKELWEAGHSASQVAARLGGFAHCTDRGRSAVIGKVHRLGLSGRTVTARKTPPPKRSRPRMLKRNKQKLFIFGAPRIASEPWVPEPEPVIPPHERKSLLGLEDGDCRYPIGDPKHDPDFGFCGRAKHAGLSYCLDHARIAYAPPKPRGTPAAAEPAPAREKVAA
jgi:GcrA cell cycle regulator